MATVAPISTATNLGAFFNKDTNTAHFNIYSSRAERIELYVFNKPIGEEKARYKMEKDWNTNIWSFSTPINNLREAGINEAIYYGYRAWGANWRYDPIWQKGWIDGFNCDVDSEGNRFNPNKLLLDPYAREVTHDPISLRNNIPNIHEYYASGQDHRQKDSGPYAPKAILLPEDFSSYGQKPQRAFKDEIIYEVHLKGFSMLDSNIPQQYRGTYRGAALKAPYLKDLGITAVEFLPIMNFQNEHNDLTPDENGDFYWGYRTLNFFSPERRYSYDKSPGGPTKELKEMVKVFHDNDIKVYMDVVYNHTGEGGLWDNNPDVANIISWRGIDNSTYYELAGDSRYYYDNTGVYGNLNVANDTTRNMVMDSLKYWSNNIGIDGFRFDLASVLGNSVERNGFHFDKFDPNNILNRSTRELPVRPDEGGNGIDLIAEPWAIGNGTYQVGGFPSHWAEWNGNYRDTIRTVQNAKGILNLSPGNVARRIAGSQDLYGDDGRKPWHSVNFIVAHDGFTLRDLYSYNEKNNIHNGTCGSSDGGSDDNISWDHYDDPLLQRQAARNGLSLLMLSAGVPMITGGDEVYRTLCGNNNPYNLDIKSNYLNWDLLQENIGFYTFSSRLLNFRKNHPAFSPSNFFEGRDRTGNGLKDITWYQGNGNEADGAYMDNIHNSFIAYRIDGKSFNDSFKSFFIAYNSSPVAFEITLPSKLYNCDWYRVMDTSPWMENRFNINSPGQEEFLIDKNYKINGRTILVLVEK